MKEENVKSVWWSKCLFIPVVLMTVFFVNCKDDENQGAIYDPGLPVKIESFSPDSGGVGTQMVIKGENFGSDPKLVKVQVGKRGYQANVIGVDGQHIYAVVAAQSDTGKVVVTVGVDDKAKTVTSEKDFLYRFSENVSTYCGTGERKLFDGPRDPQSSEPALLNAPRWLEIDNDGVMYILEGDQFSNSQELRIIRDEQVATGFRKKDNGRQGRMRTIALTKSQDTILIAHDDGDTGKANFFSSTRNKDFLDFMENVTGRNQCNTVVANPVDGEIFFNSFGRAEIFRLDKATGKGVSMGRVGDNDHEMHFCWSLDGTKLFMVVRNRHYIAVGDYDFATKTLSNIRAVMGKMHADMNAADEGHQDGKGFAAAFKEPCQMVAAPNGEYYLADRRNHCIRRITADYQVTTYAGMPGVSGMVDGLPLKAKFNNPEGICVDKDGAVYVADYDNNRIRKIVIE